MGPDTSDRARLRWVILLVAGALVAVALALLVRVDRPPVDAVEADFVARNGPWAALEVDVEPVVVPAEAPGAPSGLVLPADGWQLAVTATNDAGDTRSARYLAVGGTFWLVEETGSMVIEGG